MACSLLLPVLSSCLFRCVFVLFRLLSAISAWFLVCFRLFFEPFKAIHTVVPCVIVAAIRLAHAVFGTLKATFNKVIAAVFGAVCAFRCFVKLRLCYLFYNDLRLCEVVGTVIELLHCRSAAFRHCQISCKPFVIIVAPVDYFDFIPTEKPTPIERAFDV